MLYVSLDSIFEVYSLVIDNTAVACPWAHTACPGFPFLVRYLILELWLWQWLLPVVAAHIVKKYMCTIYLDLCIHATSFVILEIVYLCNLLFLFGRRILSLVSWKYNWFAKHKFSVLSISPVFLFRIVLSLSENVTILNVTSFFFKLWMSGLITAVIPC